MDGMENDAKEPAKERRNKRREHAIETNNLRGQIRNTPDYITTRHAKYANYWTSNLLYRHTKL